MQPTIIHGPQKLQLTAIDVFSGCGGATQGLKDAGFSIVLAIEEDVFASECYRLNHPEVTLLDRDIKKLSDAQILGAIGNSPVTLVAGCPPCQGFSNIRTKNAATARADPRNSLYLQFIRVVRLVRPQALMLENVPNFAKGGRFTRLRRELSQLGYKLTSEILDAANFGVPQRRRRLLLVGMKGLTPKIAHPTIKRVTVRHAFMRNKRYLSNDTLHHLPHRISEAVFKRIKAIPKNGGSRSALSKENSLLCHENASKGFNDVYGRLRWDDVAPTITAGVYSPSKGRFLHPDEDRCISLREAAILQGFPPSYSFPIKLGKMKLASLIGNALPPELARHQAVAIRDQIAGLQLAQEILPDQLT